MTCSIYDVIIGYIINIGDDSSMNVKRIAYINGKGGCGKTTSIFHTAGVLSKQGEKVLVIDFDKQKNTSDTLLMNNPEPPKKSVFDFMLGESPESVTGKAYFQTRGNARPKYYNVDCMIADTKLEDESLLREVDGESVGARLLDFIKKESYTWVLIDMPPSNKVLNEICFRYIADYLIVPFSSDIFSVTGYGDIIKTMEEAREINPTLSIIGVYLARYMKNCAVDQYIRDQLKEFDTFLDVQIPCAADVREGIMFGRPISYYKMFSESKTAYENLVSEMNRKIAER